MRDAFGSPQSLLVLGGTSQIAEATARAMVSAGLRRIVLAARDLPGAERVAADLRALGAVAETAALEATEFESHEQLVERLFDEHGGFDAVLFAFGLYGDQATAAADPARAREVAEVNYVGAVSLAVPVARRLRAQGQGVLIALSSVAAQRARPSEHVYASSKAGFDAYFQGVADTLHDSGVHVMLVRPAYVKTEMNASRRPPPWAIEPEEVAARIVAGLERDARVVWAPGWARVASWALRALPPAVLRRLDRW